MSNVRIRHFLARSFLALAIAAPCFAQSPGTGPANARVSASKAQSSRSAVRELVRAEERLEELRGKLLELRSKELDLQTRLDDLDYQLTPEAINRALIFVASVRPRDELRDALRMRLEGERARVKKQLELLVASREKLESTIRDADAELERLRRRVSSQ